MIIQTMIIGEESRFMSHDFSENFPLMKYLTVIINAEIGGELVANYRYSLDSARGVQ